MENYSQRYERLKSNPDQLEDEIAEAAHLPDDYLTFGEAMRKQSEYRTAFGVMAAKAAGEERSLKFNLEKIVAPACRAEAQTELEEIMSKRPTKEQINDRAVLKEDYVEAQKRYMEAQTLAATLKEVCEGLNQRAEMIQSINSRNNKEAR